MTLEDLTNDDAWPLVLLGLRLLVAGLLYLFLLSAFRTLRAELKTAARPIPRRRRGALPAPTPDPRPIPPLAPPPDPQAGTQAWIEITGYPADPARVGQRYPLVGPTLLGRDPRATIVLGDPHISARHARLVPRDGTWWIEDLGSTNGTAVNDRPVTEPVRVVSGAELRLGSVHARVRTDPARTLR